MPRSTTAWLMASVSVAFSAINPIQMKRRLIARNIWVLSVLAVMLWLFGRLFFFKQDLALHDELELGIELFFVCGSDDGGALLFDAIEYFGIDIESAEMDRKRGAAGLGALLEPGQNGGRIRAGGILAVSNDQDMFTVKRRIEHGPAGGGQ